MAFTIEKYLPRPELILQELPLCKPMREEVLRHDKEIEAILKGEDSRKLLIVGPCSAWPDTAVLDYVKRLKKVQEEVKDTIKIIIRVYTQKPRTTIGWTGPINQPNPFLDSDLAKGIRYCRRLMIDVINEGFAVADEALFTHNDGYFIDVLSWVAIGARSSEDPEHRMYASMLDIPVGLKNPTSGNLTIAINSLISAQYPHVFTLNNQQIKTTGNEYAHLVLRGGDGKPNIDFDNLKKASELLVERKIKNPSIIVDVSHDNSVNVDTGKKDASLQPSTLLRVIDEIKQDELVFKTVKGFMVESFIQDGAQNVGSVDSIEELDLNGLSITDACIGLEKTIDMIKAMEQKLV